MDKKKVAQKGKLHNDLQKYFGYDSFRPLQEEIITRCLEGGDSLVLMPTGGGKSICFQLTAMQLEGPTIVISPLIALMKDQVENLRANGIPAAFLNSSLGMSESDHVHEQLKNGDLKLLYISPEKLLSGNFIEYVKKLKPSLFAIDEAHCVSNWGHQFRPEYRELAVIKKHFPELPVMALTATADKAVRSDIVELLKLKDAVTYVSSFDRPNLSLSVLPGQRKFEQIIRIVRKHEGESGIIYCQSRKNAETLAAKLLEAGQEASFYHAGMSSEERHLVQDNFIMDRTNIICATIAFGMGIDKSDVRFVIHYNMPGSVESYYQEIGRAGRDGLDSETILFYSFQDVQIQLRFIEEIDNDQYRQVRMAKLDRIREYAEAQICRRKILLSYFGEMRSEDCGNCDVCKNPPKYFDGTTDAQMALSAITRSGEKLTMSTLVDVLRGVSSPAVKEARLERIKTFGVGRRNTAFAWQLFIMQLIQQGFIEIDYKNQYRLRLTELSKQVLFQGMSVNLISPDTIMERRKASREKKIKTEKLVKLDLHEALFEHLRETRLKIAQNIKKPAYVVFGDASLKDMATKMPATVEDFLEITGVGEHKARSYGDIFLNAINEFLHREKKNVKKEKGETYTITRHMLRQGKSPEEIAEQRDLKPETIYSHMAHLISIGEDIDTGELLSEEDLDNLRLAKTALNNETQLKPYFEFLDESLPFGKIRLGLAIIEKQLK